MSFWDKLGGMLRGALSGDVAPPGCVLEKVSTFEDTLAGKVACSGSVEEISSRPVAGDVVGRGDPVLTVAGVEYRESVFTLPGVEGPPGTDLGEAVRLFQDDVIRGLEKGDSVRAGMAAGGFSLLGELEGKRTGSKVPIWERAQVVCEAFWGLVDRAELSAAELREWESVLGPAGVSTFEDGLYSASELIEMGIEKVVDTFLERRSQCGSELREAEAEVLEIVSEKQETADGSGDPPSALPST